MDQDLSPNGSSAGSDKKKRWSTVKGVFGALGKFKRVGKKPAAGALPVPDAGTPAAPGTPDGNLAANANTLQAAHSKNSPADASLATPPPSGEPAPGAATAGDQSSPAALLAPAAPDAMTAAVESSPLRTTAVEPTPRPALLSPPAPISEETPREETPSGSPRVSSPKPPLSPRVPSPMAPSSPSATNPVSPTFAPQVSSAFALGVISPTSLSPLRERERTRSPTAWEAKLEEQAQERDPTPSKRPTHREGSPGKGWFTRSEGLWSLEDSNAQDARSQSPRKVAVQAKTLGMGSLLPNISWGQSRKPGHFNASRYADLCKDPAKRRDNVISRLATEIEAREIARRRRLATDAIYAELLRLEMETSVCLELDNLERQRSRIQVCVCVCLCIAIETSQEALKGTVNPSKSVH